MILFPLETNKQKNPTVASETKSACVVLQVSGKDHHPQGTGTFFQASLKGQHMPRRRANRTREQQAVCGTSEGARSLQSAQGFLYRLVPLRLKRFGSSSDFAIHSFVFLFVPQPQLLGPGIGTVSQQGDRQHGRFAVTACHPLVTPAPSSPSHTPRVSRTGAQTDTSWQPRSSLSCSDLFALTVTCFL